MQHATATDPWHDLLTSRYICEICLTRFFQSYPVCPACHQTGHVRPFLSLLFSVAISDEDLRTLVSQGQRMLPGDAIVPPVAGQPSPDAAEPPAFPPAQDFPPAQPLPNIAVNLDEYLPSRPSSPPESGPDFDI